MAFTTEGDDKLRVATRETNVDDGSYVREAEGRNVLVYRLETWRQYFAIVNYRGIDSEKFEYDDSSIKIQNTLKHELQIIFRIILFELLINVQLRHNATRLTQGT